MAPNALYGCTPPWRSARHGLAPCAATCYGRRAASPLAGHGHCAVRACVRPLVPRCPVRCDDHRRRTLSRQNDRCWTVDRTGCGGWPLDQWTVEWMHHASMEYYPTLPLVAAAKPRSSSGRPARGWAGISRGTASHARTLRMGAGGLMQFYNRISTTVLVPDTMGRLIKF